VSGDNKKIKVLVISDSPLAPSGVAIQTRYMIEAMLSTGKYKFICLAGAIRHNSYEPFKVEPYGDDLIVHPVDEYGNPEIIRSLMSMQKPDILWFMTDPRFFVWLWQMEDEIRPNIPMVYYHVWDNYPYPTYNKKFYTSNDVICSISKVTDDIVRNVAPSVKCFHVPHTVDTNIFKKFDNGDLRVSKFRKNTNSENRFLVFWNNRNARRKQSGSLIFWFKQFLDIVGHDKAKLIMHTEPFDPHGQNLVKILDSLGLVDGQVQISTQKVPPEELSVFYNAADCTINISDAEGFGLSTLESLACETPIIVNMTGGLQEQVTNGSDWFGVGINPSSKAVIGSQDIPWIYEDRLSGDDVVQALLKLYNMTQEERVSLGAAGRQHVVDNYGFEKYKENWVKVFDHVTTELGSWSERKNYNSWELISL